MTVNVLEVSEIERPKQLKHSIRQENELLAAVSIGDLKTGSFIINDMFGTLSTHPESDVEALRFRATELVVLLSRAALKKGADLGEAMCLSYSCLREMDSLSSADAIGAFVDGAMRRFASLMFDFADLKHAGVVFQAMSFIRENFAQKILIRNVADFVNFNPTYFSKIFKDVTGQTPGNYITAVRIAESKKLLADMSVNMVDIPELIGFESQGYFIQAFKKSEGCTPGFYRKNLLVGEQFNKRNR